MRVIITTSEGELEEHRDVEEWSVRDQNSLLVLRLLNGHHVVYHSRDWSYFETAAQ